MGKRLFRNKNLPQIKGDFKPRTFGAYNPYKGPKVSHKALTVVKLIFGALFLPFVYSASISFLDELSLIEQAQQIYFWGGALTFILIYLFIWDPEVIYHKGQQLLEIVFNYLKGFVKVTPSLLPIYTIVLFILYALLSFFIKSDWLPGYFIFLIGFSMALHLVFSAKSLRSREDSLLNADYLFGFSLVYIINLMLLAIFLSLVFNEFSFVKLCNSSVSIAKDIFYTIFKQLFLR